MNLNVFLNTAVYTLFGVVIFALAFWAIVTLAPFSVRKELEADQNIAVAILIASVILGLAFIIGSAIHG